MPAKNKTLTCMSVAMVGKCNGTHIRLPIEWHQKTEPFDSNGQVFGSHSKVLRVSYQSATC